MRKALISLIIPFLMGFIVCHFAHADSLTLQGGLEGTPNSNYGNGSEWVARYEHPFGDFGLALEGAYHGSTSHNSDSGTYGDVSGYSLLLEPIYHIPVSWRLKPYILGGVGMSWWHFDRSEDLASKGIEVSLGNSIATKGGIGADYPLGGNWFLNMEFCYFHSHVPKEAHDINGVNSIVLTDEGTIGQEEYDLMVGVKYKF